MSVKAYSSWLAVLRIYTGICWILHALPKFTDSAMFMPPNGFMGAMVAKGATLGGPYASFLSGVVQPHIDVFAQLVRIGEMSAGILLLLGLFTRLGGLIGVVLALNYLFAKGEPWMAALSGLDAVAIALSAVHLVLPTGRVFGLDTIWKKR
jgi:uncharacterized membrane protein YphA (DoxX/SURF4 family)